MSTDVRTYAGSITAGQSTGRALNIALWVAQVLLVAGFALPATMKAFTPADELARMAGDMPIALARFIGWSELAGMIGLIVPALTRIKPQLTGWAAVGLFVIMVLATALHASRGESFAFSGILGVLAAFVAWGRLKAAPIPAR